MCTNEVHLVNFPEMTDAGVKWLVALLCAGRAEVKNGEKSDVTQADPDPANSGVKDGKAKNSKVKDSKVKGKGSKEAKEDKVKDKDSKVKDSKVKDGNDKDGKVKAEETFKLELTNCPRITEKGLAAFSKLGRKVKLHVQACDVGFLPECLQLADE